MPLPFMSAVFIILTAAVITVITRVLPFVLFGGKKEMPAAAKYLGRVLPPAIMATLVIYCLKTVDTGSFPTGMLELPAVGITVLLHLWKRNTLLSIFGGTVSYMLLIHFVG